MPFSHIDVTQDGGKTGSTQKRLYASYQDVNSTISVSLAWWFQQTHFCSVLTRFTASDTPPRLKATLDLPLFSVFIFDFGAPGESTQVLRHMHVARQ